MSSDHWHYSSDIHGGAEEHHRHYDLERDIEHGKDHEHGADKIYVSGHGYLAEVLAGLQAELLRAQERITALEKQTPSAIQAQHEADTAMADLRASGWSEYDDPAYRGD